MGYGVSCPSILPAELHGSQNLLASLSSINVLLKTKQVRGMNVLREASVLSEWEY